MIATLTAIASLITGIATLLTVRELIRQRRSQHRPELIIENVGLEAVYSPSMRNKNGITLQPQMAIEARNKFNAICLVVTNVGRGVARNIHGHWSYDRQAIVTALAAHGEFIGGNIWLDGDGTTFEASDGSFMQWTGNSDLEMAPLHPFPESRAANIPFEGSYIMLSEFLLSVSMETQNLDLLDTPTLPNIRLELTYSDLEGFNYKKTFQISLRYLMISYSNTPIEAGTHVAKLILNVVEL